MEKLSQKQRTVALFLNIAIALLVHRCVSGRFGITGETSDAWLVGIVAYWILSLVSSPFFSPPKDALANGLSALIALLTVVVSSDIDAYKLTISLKILGVVVCVGVIVLSLVAIVLHAANRDSPWSRLAYRVASRLGRGELIFTPLILVSAFAGYNRDLAAVLSIVVLWSMAASVGVFEALLQLWTPRTIDDAPERLGRVERFDSPGLVRVLLASRAAWRTDEVVVVELPNQDQMLALPLFEHPGVGGRLGTAVMARAVHDYVPNIKSLDTYRTGGEALRAQLTKELSGLGEEAHLAGVVIEGSTISMLRFEATNESLKKGQVVSVLFSNGPVYYQISDAMTGEESLSGEVHGRRTASAVQLGAYRDGSGFTRFDWIPSMNSCVFVVPEGFPFPYEPSSDQRSVGVLPGTSCKVFADIDQIVHYHAAILGVTGTGKTELSLDLVRAAVEEGCKVVCVDFTGEYSKRLADVSPLQLGLPADLGKTYEDAIFAVETGTYGAPKEKEALKAFVDTIRPLIERQVDEFLSGDGRLSVLELAEITNTKASLRTTELFLSAFMSWAKAHRRKERILLVLEEAHTIVPETGGSGMDYDSKWVVDRIGQIALQGRKYGIGLLVVSQRTALVSKTILSQCNTFFTFSLVDQTSLNFLGSVFSGDFVSAVPNLESLEMICHGRAVNSSRPILVRRIFDQAKVDASSGLNFSAG